MKMGSKMETQTLSITVNNQKIVREVPHKNRKFERSIKVPNHITIKRRSVSGEKMEVAVVMVNFPAGSIIQLKKLIPVEKQGEKVTS